MEIPKELKHYVATVRSNIEFKKLNETLFTKAFETQHNALYGSRFRSRAAATTHGGVVALSFIRPNFLTSN
ncbi:hypothetical protein Lepto1548_14080 [Leptospira interrogans serovar Bataviae]|nr:hypothetical protein Lepto1548_14080 [Leptospira interrogans serovar Bataviae]